MSNSALATVKVPAYTGNYTKGRKTKITEITIHHMACVLSAQRCGEVFQNPNRQASAHYGIGNDGTIAQYVDEANTAWTNSNFDANSRAVTIEVSNSQTGGDWLVSNAALNSLIKLVADIAKRNGLGTLVKGKNLTWHSMYAATACPGKYLLSKMDYIAQEANKINSKPQTNVKAVTIDGINITRLTDYLVIYAGVKSTGTNKWGTEVVIDKNNVAISAPVYGKGNAAISAGCYVLSGHGKNATWLLENIRKGDKIKINISI